MKKNEFKIKTEIKIKVDIASRMTSILAKKKVYENIMRLIY